VLLERVLDHRPLGVVGPVQDVEDAERQREQLPGPLVSSVVKVLVIVFEFKPGLHGRQLTDPFFCFWQKRCPSVFLKTDQFFMFV
jgi:hypothetical protein